MRSRTLKWLAFLFVVFTGFTMIGASPISAQTPGPPINVSQKFGNQSETAVAINPTDPNNVVIFSNEDSVNGLFTAVTTDGGSTWAKKDVADGNDGLPLACCDPTAKFDEFGNLFLCYIDLDFSTGPHTTVALSTDGGQSFSLLKSFPGSHDQPTLVTGAGSVWVVWKDFSVAGSPLLASGAAVTGLGQVAPFNAPQSAPGSGPSSFGDIVIGPAGQVMIVAQDNIPTEGPSNMLINLDPDGLGPKGFQPAINVGSTNVGGFDYIAAQNGRSVDSETGLAWDHSGGPFNGRVYLMFTSEQPDESDDTDIMLMHSDNNGSTWSSPVRVNDDSTTNSQFLPKLALDQTSGFLAIVWHDCRNDNGIPGPDSTNNIPNDDAQFYGTISTDGGNTFVPNFRMSTGTSNAEAAFNGIDYGDYIGLDFVAGRFFPAWADNSNSTGDNPDGTLNSFDIYTCAVDVQPPGLKLSFNPPVVFAGQSSTGTIELKDPAPFGGADILLNSSNPPLASVPFSVHIDEGQTIGTFIAQTADIGAPFPAPVITATYGSLKGKATLKFVSVNVVVNPQLVFAGDTVPATITIGLPAPPGGVDVALTSSNPALASVPSSVHFNEGDTQAVVDVVTDDLGLGATDVAITATLGPNQSTYTITVIPYIVAVEFFDGLFWVPAIGVTGGEVVQARVIIAQEAPTPGGVVIHLTSGDPNVCQVTPSVTVPAGQIVQYFFVFTTPVANDQSVEIRASARGSSRAGIVTVLAPVPTLITLSPTSVEGGKPSGATVYLTGNAPNTGLDVTLSSDKPEAIVPPVLHIQPGKNLGTFVVSTTPVANKVVANITASYNGTSVSAPLTITGAGLVAFTINPTQIAAGGQAKATAVLSSPAPVGGVTVNLSYVNGSALVNPPTTLFIPQNATNGFVNLTGAMVTNSTPVTVTATYKSTSKQATVTVLGNRVISVTANPQTLHVNTKAACKVYLAAPAPQGGVVVNLAATSGELPIQVRILAGQTSAAFNYKAPANVPNGGKATITATYPAGISVTTVVSIIP